MAVTAHSMRKGYLNCCESKMDNRWSMTAEKLEIVDAEEIVAVAEILFQTRGSRTQRYWI